jgi:hypothetical protein
VCGSRLAEGAAFCGWCGRAVGPVPEGRRAARRLWWAVLGLAGLYLAGTMLVTRVHLVYLTDDDGRQYVIGTAVALAFSAIPVALAYRGKRRGSMWPGAVAVCWLVLCVCSLVGYFAVG